ncbi:hypothetical protein [Lentzea sp. NPDC092896]|uniref:hypothetical protein n=1 Tax=Lentzea sp. NPDC092896 TaxID=3364127 RepID=UPI0038290A56
MANDDKWALRKTLPDGLDLEVVLYRENADAPAPRLGGLWAVWPDQVWWQRPDGRWQRGIVTARDLETTPQRWRPAPDEGLSSAWSLAAS